MMRDVISLMIALVVLGMIWSFLAYLRDRP